MEQTIIARCILQENPMLSRFFAYPPVATVPVAEETNGESKSFLLRAVDTLAETLSKEFSKGQAVFVKGKVTQEEVVENQEKVTKNILFASYLFKEPDTLNEHKPKNNQLLKELQSEDEAITDLVLDDSTSREIDMEDEETEILTTGQKQETEKILTTGQKTDEAEDEAEENTRLPRKMILSHIKEPEEYNEARRKQKEEMADKIPEEHAF